MSSQTFKAHVARLLGQHAIFTTGRAAVPASILEEAKSRKTAVGSKPNGKGKAKKVVFIDSTSNHSDYIDIHSD